MIRPIMPVTFPVDDAASSMSLITMGMKVSQGAAGPVALNANIQRQARRLYFGSIPYGVSEKEISEFVNRTMRELDIASGKLEPVIAVQINHDKNYAFVEVFSIFLRCSFALQKRQQLPWHLMG